MRVTVYYWSNPYFVYTYRYVSLEQIFILVSQRREQNEAISLAGVCVSAAYSAYVHHCGQLYVYMYMCIVYMCLCRVPVVITHSVLFLVGPESVEL